LLWSDKDRVNKEISYLSQQNFIEKQISGLFCLFSSFFFSVFMKNSNQSGAWHFDMF